MRNTLSQGYYTVSEAAALIAFDVVGINDRKLRNFFRETKHYKPAVETDRASKSGRVKDISFLDLMELRAISYFRNRGASAQALRVAAANARDAFGEYPFSRRDIVFHKSGRAIIAAAAEEEKDEILLNLVNHQYEFDHVRDFFDYGVAWDAKEQFPKFWHPDERRFPNVTVDPRVSFGRPSVESYGIETDTLHSAWLGAEGDYHAVANWFEVPNEIVEEAIKFQRELPN